MSKHSEGITEHYDPNRMGRLPIESRHTVECVAGYEGLPEGR